MSVFVIIAAKNRNKLSRENSTEQGSQWVLCSDPKIANKLLITFKKIGNGVDRQITLNFTANRQPS